MRRNTIMNGSTMTVARVISPPARLVESESEYHRTLRDSCERYRMSPRGKNGISDQSRLPASRIEEILRGDMPTLEEHKALCRCFLNLKHLTNTVSLYWANAKVEHSAKDEASDDQAAGAAPKEAASGPRRDSLASPFVSSSTPSPSAPKPAQLALVNEGVKVVAKIEEQPKVDKPDFSIKARSFGERLRACREKEALLQAQLAELVGTNQSTVSQWELDYSVPVAGHYAKLLDLFPALKLAPKPAVRDIAKPKGPQGMVLGGREPEKETPAMAIAVIPVPDSKPAPEEPKKSVRVARTSTDPMALIRYGRKLETVRGLIEKEKRQAVVDLLRLGEAANLDVEQILESFIEE